MVEVRMLNPIKPLKKRTVDLGVDHSAMEWEYVADSMADPVGSEQVFTQGRLRGSTFIEVTRTYPEQASALAASKKLTAENRSYLQWVKMHYEIDIEKKQVRRKTATLAAAETIPIGAVVKTEELTEAMRNCCLLYTSPSPRDRQKSRMPSSA